MPFIGTKTTVTITPEKEIALKTRFGKAIEAIPGKSEAWLMTEFTGDAHLYFKGDNTKPSAFVEVKIFGTTAPENYEKLTALLCDILNDELSVPQDRIYITYQSFTDWGWNGNNF